MIYKIRDESLTRIDTRRITEYWQSLGKFPAIII